MEGRHSMPSFTLEELRTAYGHFAQVSDECAASGDYNAFADQFTEDCIYVEHAFGEMHGSEAVRKWIVPVMKEYPANLMTYTHDWVVFDESNGWVIFCGRNHLPSVGDGVDYSATNWTRIDYAGDGLWCREEDIYNPDHMVMMATNWRAAQDAVSTDNTPNK
jgi:SnoaL-like domain